MDFVNRLKLFMENGDISISQFADTCRIPRPTMSQILNGRNKKVSDELIAKIHAAYPELSVLWLMFGEGTMLMQSNTQISEPQNARTSPDWAAQPSEPQPSAKTNDVAPDLFANLAEKSGDKEIPFINSENTGNAYPQPSTSANTAPDAMEKRSVYVHTHELIDFDDSTHGDYDSNPSARNIACNNGNGGNPTATSPTSSAAPCSTTQNDTYATTDGAASAAHTTGSKRNISLATAADKRITNIVVFYSDNSFQSFYPTSF